MMELYIGAQPGIRVVAARWRGHFDLWSFFIMASTPRAVLRRHLAASSSTAVTAFIFLFSFKRRYYNCVALVYTHTCTVCTCEHATACIRLLHARIPHRHHRVSSRVCEFITRRWNLVDFMQVIPFQSVKFRFRIF